MLFIHECIRHSFSLILNLYWSGWAVGIEMCPQAFDLAIHKLVCIYSYRRRHAFSIICTQALVFWVAGGWVVHHHRPIAISYECPMHSRIAVYRITHWWHRKYASPPRAHRRQVEHRAAVCQYVVIAVSVLRKDEDRPLICRHQL